MKGKHTPPPPPPLGKFALFHSPHFSLPFLSYPSPRGRGGAQPGGDRGRRDRDGRGPCDQTAQRPGTSVQTQIPRPGWSPSFGSGSGGCLRLKLGLLARDQQGNPALTDPLIYPGVRRAEFGPLASTPLSETGPQAPPEGNMQIPSQSPSPSSFVPLEGSFGLVWGLLFFFSL